MYQVQEQLYHKYKEKQDFCFKFLSAIRLDMSGKGVHKIISLISIGRTKDEELVDTLTAISVISKQLAKKIKEDEQYEQNETTE